MQRLRLQVDVCADSEMYVRLTPGARIGAVPLVGPATRRVVAGILVEPRFRWPAQGAVFNSIGFTVEPALGGSPPISTIGFPPAASYPRDLPLAGPRLAREFWHFAPRSQRMSWTWLFASSSCFCRFPISAPCRFTVS